jgi:guanylate kinase
MLIVSSPSGAGKTSLCRRLLADTAELHLSTSATTRAPRPGEQDGREYHFIDDAAFQAMVDRGEFLEHAVVHDNAYGSPRAPVEEALSEGRDVLFDIDWQGARRLAQAAPGDAVRVFVLPPSITELRRRLYARAQDEAEVIERRVARARDEIAHWGEYDYVFVNDDFDRSYAELAHIYRGERARRERNTWVTGFVDELMTESG